MRIGVFRVGVQGCRRTITPFYNAQYIGVSKALGKLCEEVIIYENILPDYEESIEVHADNVKLYRYPSKIIGVNGFMNLDRLDTSIDVLVLFSDIQLDTPRIVRWANKNNILVLPFIGVLESHSDSAIKRMLMDLNFNRVIRAYRKCHCCLAKTPSIYNILEKNGIKNITMFPAGLNSELLNVKYAEENKGEIKKKFGYNDDDDKVLLNVGRLVDERNPLRSLRIFERVLEFDDTYKLLYVGKGELGDSLREQIKEKGLESKVQIIDAIPNNEMWEVYMVADYLLSFNENEIFGMSILEAMYYGVTVIASHAPGPEYTVENNVSGYLINTDDEVIEKIKGKKIDPDLAHARVENNFMWDKIAPKVIEIANKEGIY